MTEIRMMFLWHSVYVDDIIITFNPKNTILGRVGFCANHICMS